MDELFAKEEKKWVGFQLLYSYLMIGRYTIKLWLKVNLVCRSMAKSMKGLCLRTFCCSNYIPFIKRFSNERRGRCYSGGLTFLYRCIHASSYMNFLIRYKVVPRATAKNNTHIPSGRISWKSRTFLKHPFHDSFYYRKLSWKFLFIGPQKCNFQHFRASSYHML